MTPRFLIVVAASIAPLVAASPAAAKTYTFRAAIGGTAPPTVTGSPAGGRATVRVDASGKRVAIDLTVDGIAPDKLSQQWIKQPAGPVTFNDCRGPDDCDAVAGIAYGADYRAKGTGFQLSVRGIDYAAVAKAMNSPLSLDDFVNGLRAGRIVIVIHTERFPAGEISGRTREN